MRLHVVSGMITALVLTRPIAVLAQPELRDPTAAEAASQKIADAKPYAEICAGSQPRTCDLQSTIRAAQRYVLIHGTLTAIRPEFATDLKLPSRDYPVCGAASRDVENRGMHLIFAGADKKSVIFSFRSDDGSYSLSWRADLTGELIASILVKRSGAVYGVLVDEQSQARFIAEIEYWASSLTKMRVDRTCSLPPG